MRKFKALPSILAWSIWLARNVSVFYDNIIRPIQCATQGIGILNSFTQMKKEKPTRQIVAENIDKYGMWA